ncbi:DUF3108 domain-containing protein [Thalassomonas sp. M1454]|uniref:DUF3108 domain-containing protein n=1 Tax=Thalassomonas sp. M1454 TaxID=2594477 RepID=UPI0021B09FB8|nr:DUF3108 domain-containing protein [Thalassomonas sp. M1454]
MNKLNMNKSNMPHKTIRGTIKYTSNKPERLGHVRGREYFSQTVHANGARTLRAQTEIEDAPAVLRDVVYSVDENWKPLDGFSRISVGDEFVGTGWYRFTDEYAECESFTKEHGRQSQKLPLDKPVLAVGAHPTCGDAWFCQIFNIANGPGQQFFENLMLTSPDHRGATGPELFPFSYGLQYVGKEEITVAAGTFNALHFQFVETPGALPEDHPLYDVWFTDDGDYIFLKGQVGGYMQTAYELEELQITHGAD